jgi:hypothetical protein
MLTALEAAPAELTPGQAAPDWVQEYGSRNKDCLEWSDTCVNCVRAQSGENFSCSNITADSIGCTVGTIDITAHVCKLTFGAKTVNLTGRAAHELYATMAQAGVPSQSTTNALSEGLSHLICTINPLEIARRSGGGADCTFDAGI